MPGLGQLRVALEGGDAEVGEHGPAAVGEQHVARLHVAMQHAGRVRGGQRGQQLAAGVGGLVRRQRAVLGDDLVQRPRATSSITIHGLPSASTTSKTVTTPGMVEPRRRSWPRGGSAGRPWPGHRGPQAPVADAHLLDGDVTVQDRVPGSPDGAHGPAADGLLEEVAPRDHPPRARHSVHGRTIHGGGSAGLPVKRDENSTCLPPAAHRAATRRFRAGRLPGRPGRPAADGEQRRLRLLGEEVVPLVVHDDERREVADLDTPDRFHAEFRVLEHLDLGDAVLGQPGRGAADGAEVEAAVARGRPG